MDNRAGEMRVFLRVVEAGSFSEAARRMRTTPSTVSKLIARLETRLGLRLLERSTRHLSLTAEGRIYHERSQAVLAELEAVESDLRRGAASAGGTVRVNASVAFGILGLEPVLPAFWGAYPNIVVDLSLSDEIVDLHLDRTDIAFRIGALADCAMTARRIGTSRRSVVASPEYLARHGMPRTAEDLARHNCLGFNFRRAVPVWLPREGGRVVGRAAPGTLLANNGDSVRRMALAGVGLARLAEYHARDDLAAGRLVAVPEAVVPEDEEQIHALFLGGERVPHRVRAFLDFVLPRLQAFLRG